MAYKFFICIFLATFAFNINAQNTHLRQYSSFCEEMSIVGGKSIQERINRISHPDYWIVEVTLIKPCGLILYPSFIKTSDTLYVTTKKTIKQTNTFEDGTTIIDIREEAECECAYVIKMEFNTDTIDKVIVDNKSLPLTDEKFVTYPIQYFIHNNDTTGFVDKYGLKQGCIVRENKDGSILKQHYKDDVRTEFELFNKDGILQKRGKTMNDIIQ